MKEFGNRPKGQTYEPPRAEFINIESQGVLCASGMRGGNEAYGMDNSFNM